MQSRFLIRGRDHLTFEGKGGGGGGGGICVILEKNLLQSDFSLSIVWNVTHSSKNV